MTQTVSVRVFGALTALTLTACGGSSPPPSDATSESASSASKEAAAAPSASDTAGETEKPAPASTEKAASEPAPSASSDGSSEMPPKQLGDTITQTNIAYMINYNESEPKNAADKLCSKESHDDPRLHAKCMEKERSKFLADCLVFTKDDKGAFFTVYRRVGTALKEISKSRIDLANDKGTSIDVSIKSDKGSRPVASGKKEFTVTAPSDATIQIDDPKLGKLLYDARIGLVGPSGASGT